ncbi:hypothetical protein [Microcystis aeruginosa]|uniref:Uncharacterized protein n=1 Tax=Microcystis aeruginosa PCC 9701 TaxID=721123 RepID=I4INR3_MICAE|nr:hypothetical protein [Microcystis aeruginosa]CCI35937.1 conserved hypothetical protein [Microcystis aeruginosa PCC 9701]
MTIIIGIGSSAAGLSTYLATLAYHQKHQVKSLKVLSCQVTPISADARKLSYKAENILKEQVMLEPGKLYHSFCQHPFYSFTITLEIKGLFWAKNTEKVSFHIYDMPDNLLRDIKEFSSSHSFTEYYDDLFSDIGGYFLPIDGTSHREDEVYAKSLEKFTTDLTQRNPQGCPIAFAVTKCDLSELWVNRDDPRGMVQRRFPKMYAILENWTQENKGKVEYFTTSSFGVFGKYCEPNSIIKSKSKEGTMAVIRNPQEWQPFGLIEPLYWLCTGKML